MTPLTDAYREEIERKIDEHGNGDVDRMELTLLMAIYKKVENLEVNPAIKFGESIKNNKGLTAFIVFVFWLLVILIPNTLVQFMGLPAH